jgi:hypothetical protein
LFLFHSDPAAKTKVRPKKTLDLLHDLIL